MIKNLLLYRINEGWSLRLQEMVDALAKACFVPVAPTEEMSIGWAPPRKDGDLLVESVNGHWLMALNTERRLLPSFVVNAEADKRAVEIEKVSGRKPGKKQMKDLKEQIRHEMLPSAFVRQGKTLVWIDAAQRLLGLGVSSHRAADEMVSLLVKTAPGIQLHAIQTAEPPTSCMAAWLADGVTPESFTFDRDCVLRGEDEMRSVVRYTRRNLDDDAVKGQLQSGMRPVSLAMTYRDRVSFVLTDTLQIKSIKFLDLAMEGATASAGDDPFDTDVMIATAELSAMIPALIDGFGGEAKFGQESGSDAGISTREAALIETDSA